MLSCLAMGRVRRGGWRLYLPYLGLNVLVSVLTVSAILALTGRGAAITRPTPTPTLDIAARVASAIPTPSPTLPPSPTPHVYVVQSGDTLNAIAEKLGITVEALMAANGLTDPDALDVGQVLVVPSFESGTQPTPAVPARATASSSTSTPLASAQAPRVEIRGVDAPGDLETEAVRLLNTGGVAAMVGWTLDDGEGQNYIFPAFTLHSGAVSVHTRAGTDTVIDLYWGLDEAIWTAGKLITLRDAAGTVRSTFRIPGN